MVSERDRYAPSTEGAPPVPPAGGYRGRRRMVSAQQVRAQTPGAQTVSPAEAIARIATPAPNVKGPSTLQQLSSDTTTSALRAWGTVAIAAAAIFAGTMLLMLFGAKSSTFWETPMILIQVGVIALGVYAVTKPPARFRALIALSICALVNIVTVSMASMLFSSVG